MSSPILPFKKSHLRVDVTLCMCGCPGEGFTPRVGEIWTNLRGLNARAGGAAVQGYSRELTWGLLTRRVC